MKPNKWKRTVAALAAAFCVIASALPAYADDTASEAAAEASGGESAAGYELARTSEAYPLTDNLQVEVTSLLNERTSSGTRIVAVISMKNVGAKTTRVPDYDLRVRTTGGGEYALSESTTNAKSVQPNAKVELSYATLIDGLAEDVALSELVWIETNWYVYPKEETAVLTVPVSGFVWSGSNEKIDEHTPVLSWGKPFRLPTENETLTFTPVSVTKSASEQKLNYIVKMLVENPGAFVETIPDFTLEGRDGQDAFTGSRIEQGTLTLEAGEKRYIHFAVPTDQDSALTNILVMTTEQAVTSDSTYQYSVGRINIELPEGGQTGEQAVDYTLKQTIPFDPLNKLIGTDVSVSLVELSSMENDAKGYKTIMAKFKLRNLGQTPVPVPAFQTELLSADGYTYSGYRQTNAPEQLMPNLSHVVGYSFVVPAAETGEHLTLKLLDTTTVSPYKSTISALNVAVQNPDQETVWSFYPFEVKLNDWSASSTTNYTGSALTPIQYSYKLKLDLDVKQVEDVVVDDTFSKMLVAIEDSLGRELGEETLSFTGSSDGNRKLVSGLTTVEFDDLSTDDHEYPLTFKVYETIETSNGTAKRLLGSFKQAY